MRRFAKIVAFTHWWPWNVNSCLGLRVCTLKPLTHDDAGILAFLNADMEMSVANPKLLCYELRRRQSASYCLYDSHKVESRTWLTTPKAITDKVSAHHLMVSLQSFTFPITKLLRI